MAGEREELRIFEVARRTGQRPVDVLRLLDKTPTARVGRFKLERLGRDLVALTVAPVDEPHWKRLADEAREQLRAQARAGDRRACAALADLGELVAPRPWNETTEGE